MLTMLIGAATFAETCPILSGQFECEGTSKEFSGTVQIGQNGIKYYLPFVSNPQFRETYLFIADNRPRVHKEKNSHTGEMTVIKKAQCKGNVLVTDSAIKEINYLLRSTYALDVKTKKIAVNDTYFQDNKLVASFYSLCKPIK